MSKIILKRAKLEQWVELPYFNKMVLGTYVKVVFQVKYRLAEIVDIKELKGQEYELGKVRTNI